MVETVDEVVLSVADLVPNPGENIQEKPIKFDAKYRWDIFCTKFHGMVHLKDSIGFALFER